MNENRFDAATAFQASDVSAVNPILAHLSAGRLEQADEAVTELVAQAPDNGHGWKALGVIRYQQGRAEEALMALRKAVACLPNDVEARRNLGFVLQTIGRLPEAINEFSAALAVDSSDLLTQVTLGRLFMLDGKLPEAVAHFRQALALRLLHDTVVKPSPPQQPLDQASGEKLLWQTLADLAKAGVHAFACSGTLLGLERDGTLLPFDKDIDIALPFFEMDDAVACLQTQGWMPGRNQMRLISPLEFVHDKSGMFMDIFGIGLEKETGKAIGGFWRPDLPWEWQRIVDYPPLTLHQVQREEGVVWALDHPADWLEAIYGDWRTPDPDFDTVIAAHNLRGFALLTQCYALYRINQRWESGQVRKALALSRHFLRKLPEDVLLQQAAVHLDAALANA